MYGHVKPNVKTAHMDEHKIRSHKRQLERPMPFQSHKIQNDNHCNKITIFKYGIFERND